MSFNAIGGDGFDVSGSKFTASIKSAFGIHDKVVQLVSGVVVRYQLTKPKFLCRSGVKDAGNAQIRLQNTHTIGPLALAYIKRFLRGKTSRCGIGKVCILKSQCSFRSRKKYKVIGGWHKHSNKNDRR